MYKNCKKNHAKLRQQHIVQTFNSLLVKYPLNEITITMLCQHAGIPRKAFYRYFDSIYDLLDCWADTIFHELIENIQLPKNLETIEIQKTFYQFFLFWEERKHIVHAIRNNQLSNQFFMRMMNSFFAMAQELNENNIEEELLSIRLQIIIPSLISLLYIWDNQKYSLSAKELAKLAYTVMSKPLV